MNLVLLQKVICFQIIDSRIQVNNCVLIRSINGDPRSLEKIGGKNSIVTSCKRAFTVQKRFNLHPAFYTVTKSCYTRKTLQKIRQIETKSDFKLRDKFQFA